MKRNGNVLFLTQFSMLLAIEAIVCFTPLGSIPIGPVVATLAMIPVIITTLLLGVKAGAAMGFITGCFSFVFWTLNPTNVLSVAMFSPLYWLTASPANYLCAFGTFVNCFVARTLVGLITAGVFNMLSRIRCFDAVKYIASGFLGSFGCTLTVMASTYFLIGKPYAEGIMQADMKLLAATIGSIITTNGLIEAVLGGFLGYALCKPIKKYLNKE